MALIDNFRNQAQVRLAEGYSPDQLAQYAQNLGLTDAEINYALGITGVRPGDADTNARIAAAVKQGQIQRGTYTRTATELTAAALAERTGDDPDRVLQQLQSGISAADYLANNETEQMNIAFAEGQRQAQINAENYLRDQASRAATTNTPVTTGPDLGSVDALIDPQQYVLPTDLAPFTPEDAASRYQQQLDVSQFTPSTYGVEPLMTQAQYDAGGVAASQGNTSGAAPINAISTTPIGYQATDPSSQSFTTRARQFRIVPAQTRMGGPQVVGAASTAPISFPNVPYQSELIKSLRDANKDPLSNNRGVTLLPNLQNSTLVLDFNRPPPDGLSNKPQPPGNNSGGGNGGGGGGGGGPIVIGPGGGSGGGSIVIDSGGGGVGIIGGNVGGDDGIYDNILDDNGDDQLGGSDLGKTTIRDDDTGDDQIGDGNLGKTTGNGDDDTGDDQLGGGKLGGDVSDAEIPDYTDDLWGPNEPTDSGDAQIPDYTNDLWGDSEPDLPDYTNDLWGDDVVDVPDYTDNLWGDNDAFSNDFMFDVEGSDFGDLDWLFNDVTLGGGGGGGNSLMHLFMQE